MFEARLKKLKRKLAEKNIDAFLVSSASNILYLTGVDSFSQIEREAYLYVAPRTAYLFTDMRYIEGIMNILPKGIKLLDRSELFTTIKTSQAFTIGIENNFTVAELSIFKKQTKKKFVNISHLVEDLRAQKDNTEIALLRSSATLTDMAFKYILPFIKIGVTEKEIADRIENFIRSKGGVLAFESIVAFGPNSAIPHHKTSGKKLTKKDSFILLDFGAKTKNYCSDMTRTILTKSASNRAKLVYETVYHAQMAAAKKIMGGERSLSKITAESNGVMSQNNFPDIPHGLGHGVGIEVHELPNLSPKSKGKLTDGVVFTIEPGIYIPGFGGVRIEDDFLFKDGKLEQLTKSPKDLITI